MLAPLFIQPRGSRSPHSGSAFGPLRIVDIAAFVAAIKALGTGHVERSEAMGEIRVASEIISPADARWL